MEGKGNFIVGFRRSFDDDSLVVVFLFSFLILVSRSSLTTQRINMRCVLPRRYSHIVAKLLRSWQILL